MSPAASGVRLPIFEKASCLDYDLEAEKFYHGSDFHTPDCSSEDIPKLQIYLSRQAKLYPHRVSTVLPDGYPSYSAHSTVWSGEQLAAQDFCYDLVDSDVIEIETALKNCIALKINLAELSPSTFSLPVLGDKLRALKLRLWERGLVILKGLDPTRYNLYENIVLYIGVTSYVSSQRGVQGVEKDFLVHVRDVTPLISSEQYRRETYSYKAQPFHTDYCHILTMYAISTAAKGGRCMWASSVQVYNELASTRPEVLKVLADSSWPFESPGGSDRYYTRPLLFLDNGRPLFFFSRRNLTGSAKYRRSTNIPQLTEIQADALDALHFAALRHSVRHAPEKGEMHIVNNLALMHAREDFVDPDEGSGRHLMRLWLRDDDQSASLPSALLELFEGIYGSKAVEGGKWELNGFNGFLATTDESTGSSS